MNQTSWVHDMFFQEEEETGNRQTHCSDYSMMNFQGCLGIMICSKVLLGKKEYESRESTHRKKDEWTEGFTDTQDWQNYLSANAGDNRQSPWHLSNYSITNGAQSSLYTGLSKFFGIPLVPGLVWTRLDKSWVITKESRFRGEILTPPLITNSTIFKQVKSLLILFQWSFFWCIRWP